MKGHELYYLLLDMSRYHRFPIQVTISTMGEHCVVDYGHVVAVKLQEDVPDHKDAEIGMAMMRKMSEEGMRPSLVDHEKGGKKWRCNVWNQSDGDWVDGVGTVVEACCRAWIQARSPVVERERAA